MLKPKWLTVYLSLTKTERKEFRKEFKEILVTYVIFEPLLWILLLLIITIIRLWE